MNKMLVTTIDKKGQMKFHIPYSNKGGATKQELQLARGRMSFVQSLDKATYGFDKLIMLLSKGREFLSVAGHNTKKAKAFLYSHIIAIDIDESNVSLDDFIYWIGNNDPNLIPSIYYETFSSTKENPRFRLLYVFNTPLKVRRYKSIYKEIASDIESYFPNIKVDTSFLNNPVHRFSGTSPDKAIHCTYKVFIEIKYPELYEALDPDDYFKVVSKLEHCQSELIKMWKLFNVSSDDILDSLDYMAAVVFDSDYGFLKYYANNARLKSMMKETNGRTRSKNPLEFIEDHQDEYDTISKSETNWDEDETMKEVPDDYFDINWVRRFYGKTSTKIKDGQKRRMYLSIFATALKKIKEDITSDELYYNLFKERTNNIDNSVDPISNNYLRELAVETSLLTKEEVDQRLENIKRPKMLINPNSNRKSVGSVKGHKSTKKPKWDTSLIDWSLPCKENYWSIKKEFPELKESTFNNYYNRHNPYNDSID